MIASKSSLDHNEYEQIAKFFLMLKIRYLLLIFLLCFQVLADAQRSITGQVIDTRKEAVVGANVLLYGPGDVFLDYTITDERGNFSLADPESKQEVSVKIHHLSYENKTIPLSRPFSHLRIVMKDNNILLQEIMIKAKHPGKIGDTLRYNVGEYRQTQDVNLEEIMRRMPGIDIDESGKIHHNGLPISKFYIEGLDMLEGRYGIATQQINPDLIESVEVLENHQHIKVLRGLEVPPFSAINIKLKNKLVVTFNAKAGTGFSPALHELQGSLFSFRKKYQFNTNFSSNNTAKSSVATYTNHYQTARADNSGIAGRGVNLSALQKPQISNLYYLNNSTQIADVSLLTKLSESDEIKIAFNVLRDQIKETGTRKESYLVADNVIQFYDTLTTILRPVGKEITFRLEQNRSKIFLKNEWSIKWKNETGEGNNIFRSGRVTERLHLQQWMMALRTDVVFRIKGKAIKLATNLSYMDAKSGLTLSPSQFSDPRLGLRSFNTNMQDAATKYWKASTSNGHSFMHSSWLHELSYGLNLDRKYYSSELLGDSLGLFRPLGDQYTNNYFTNEIKLDFNNQFTRQFSKAKLRIQLPATYRKIWAKLSENQSKKSLFNGIVGRPEVSLTGRRLSGSYGFSNEIFGGNLDYSQGLMLYSYRNLSQGNFNFTRNYMHKAGIETMIGSQFKKVSGLLSVSVNRSITDIVENNIISNSGSSALFLNRRNVRDGLQAGGTLTQYYFDRSLKVDIDVSRGISIGQSVINTKTTPSKLLNYKIGNNYQISFDNMVVICNNTLQILKNNSNNLSYEYKGNVELFYNLNKYGKVTVNLNLLWNKIKDLTSINDLHDVKYVLNFPKKKLHFEVFLTNITNNQSFVRILRSEFYEQYTHYKLRPRQILFTVTKAF
jgi:hypothetical protein